MYQKHTWVSKEIIRRELLQNIEDGIYNEQERAIEAENALVGDLATEVTRATTAENSLSSRITNCESDISAETDRATARENALEQLISDETDRAIEAEETLATSINTINDAISNETARAIASENSLTNAINAETLRAQEAEQTITDRATLVEDMLETAITDETARATAAEDELRTYVDVKTSSAYKASGSVYFADLPAPTASRLGNVYNIKDDFTTTDQFVEGAGRTYGAGADVVITRVESGSSIVYMYDVMMDFIDLSPYAEKETTHLTTDAASTNLADADYIPFFDTSENAKKKTLLSTLKTFLAGVFVKKTDYATTTSAGVVKPDGTSITVDANGKISSSGTVSGVKGNSESSYRTGNVNITAANIGLGNVGNFKAVSTVANQGLSDTEKANARSNIGAGSSSFSGSYNDLSNKPSAMSTDEANTGTATTSRFMTASLFRSFTDRTAWIGTCSTAAETAAKVVSVDTGFKLVKGARIGVKFTNSNTASSCTINVNSTGAKSIYYNNAAYTGNSNTVCGYANRYTFYIYDGTYWVWDSYSNDANSTYGVVSTSANGLAPKVTDTSKYLRGDGTWQTPTNTTYGVVSTSANGLAPKVTDTSKFLKGDGTWATPTNTTYSAGTGLTLSGTKFKTNVPRVSKSCNSLPGKNTVIFEEYKSGTNYNLPSNHYYHIMTMEGPDDKYATQIALGMTTTNCYHRNYNNGTWGSWIAFKSQADIDSAVAAAKVGTAGQNQVLSGYTFTNNSSSGLAGKMENGANTWAWTNADNGGGFGVGTYTWSSGGTTQMAYAFIRAKYVDNTTKIIIGEKAALEKVIKSGSSIAGVAGTFAGQEKTVTAGTSAASVTPDSGKWLSKVTYNPTPTQEKTITASRSAQTVTPDSGKHLSKVTVNKYPDATGTFTPSSSQYNTTAADMGATNNYRYVNTQVAYNAGKSAVTYTVVTQGVYNSGGGDVYSSKKGDLLILTGDFSTNFATSGVEELLTLGYVQRINAGSGETNSLRIYRTISDGKISFASSVQGVQGKYAVALLRSK